MIELCQGNLLESDADALVNPVNCVGVMGKGLALQFKRKFPRNFVLYEAACLAHHLRLGKVYTVNPFVGENERYIINFPTKRHWRDQSRIEDIQAGLVSLVEEIKRLKIRSLAIPALGCGYGNLTWEVVQPLIEAAFAEIPHVVVHLFVPIPEGPSNNDYVERGTP